MTLREYVDTFRSQWVVIVSAIILGLLLGGLVTIVQPDRYDSEVTFYVATQATGADSASAYDGTLLAQEKVKSYVELLGDDRLAEDVSARLNGSVGPGDVASAIDAMSPPETSLIRMTVSAGTPSQAQLMAEAVAEQFTALVADLERPTDPRALPTVTVRVVRSASPSTDAVSPTLATNLAVGGMLGLLVGLLAALARSVLDTRLRTVESLAEIANAAPLGTTVKDPEILHRPVALPDRANSPEAEALRHIRTSLSFIAIDRPCKVLVITSALQQEGKSSLACNLAAALGTDGQRVALISADLRRPSLERILQLEQSVGLTTVLSGRAELDVCVQPWRGGLFDVLATGRTPPNPSELLRSARMRDLIDTMRLRYDLVLVDVPPVLPVTDAVLLSTLVDGVILVGRHGMTTRKSFERAVASLSMSPTPVVGTIMTAAPRGSTSPYHYAGAAAAEENVSAAPSAPITRPKPSPVPSSRGCDDKGETGVGPTRVPAETSTDAAETHAGAGGIYDAEASGQGEELIAVSTAPQEDSEARDLPSPRPASSKRYGPGTASRSVAEESPAPSTHSP